MPDLLFDGFGRAGGVDHEETRRLLLRERVVKVAYLSVEISAEDLESVGLAMVAHRGTAETAGRVEVEQDGQVRADGPAGEAIGGFDERAVEASAARLIGDRGVDKTIAEHDLARGEGRSDDLGDELSATGREEEGLSGRLDDRAGVFKDIPHLLAKGRTAGLTEAQHPLPGSTETILSLIHI